MAPKATSTTFKPFVVLFGGEDFFLDRDVEKVRSGKREVLYLDAEDGLTDSALVEKCQTYSEEPRTIIVENAQKVKGYKALKAFIEEYDTQDTSLILVAVVRSDKLSEVWSAAISKGKGVERKKPSPWKAAEEYADFLRVEATRLGVSLDKGVATTLIDYVGPDLYRLDNELRKLALYVGRPNTIKREHIALVTSPTPKADVFQVSDAVMQKDSRKALRLFSILYANAGDGGLVPLVGALMKQVEKIVIVRSLQDKGVSDEDIAVLIGQKPWLYKNSTSPVARKHDIKSLIGHMRRLCKLDADVKGPARSKRSLVELTMLSIAS